MPGYDCPQFYEFWTSQVARARTVVIAAYWESYPFPTVSTDPSWVARDLINQLGSAVNQSDVEEAWQKLGNQIKCWRADGKRVVLLSSNPAWPTFHPLAALRRFGQSDLSSLKPVSREEFNKSLSRVEVRLQNLATVTGAELIRPADYFCKDGVCPATDMNGVPLYRDDHHLRPHAQVSYKLPFVAELLRP